MYLIRTAKDGHKKRDGAEQGEPAVWSPTSNPLVDRAMEKKEECCFFLSLSLVSSVLSIQNDPLTNSSLSAFVFTSVGKEVSLVRISSFFVFVLSCLF